MKSEYWFLHFQISKKDNSGHLFWIYFHRVFHFIAILHNTVQYNFMSITELIFHFLLIWHWPWTWDWSLPVANVREVTFQSWPLSLFHNADKGQDHSSDACGRSLSSSSFLTSKGQLSQTPIEVAWDLPCGLLKAVRNDGYERNAREEYADRTGVKILVLRAALPFPCDPGNPASEMRLHHRWSLWSCDCW